MQEAEHTSSQASRGEPGVPEPPIPEADLQDQPRRLWLHGLLFFATCATTFSAGYLNGRQDAAVLDGLMYMLAIMGILGVHEMGHFAAARFHRVDASLPFFIPMPLPPIGTFGAVIRMRKPPDTRAALLDIGAAGPLAGLLVAIPVCFIGLELSPVQPLADLPDHAILEGNSLIYLLLKYLAHPGMGPGDDVFLHPLAWAGWIGLLVTSLNLLPAGQLDGGHILYGLLGPKAHARVARAVRLGVLSLGTCGLVCTLLMLYDPAVEWIKDHGLQGAALRGSGMLGWLVWAVLLRFVGRKHPPVNDERAPLSTGRKAIAWLSLVLLLLTFMPVFVSQVRP